MALGMYIGFVASWVLAVFIYCSGTTNSLGSFLFYFLSFAAVIPKANQVELPHWVPFVKLERLHGVGYAHRLHAKPKMRQKAMKSSQLWRCLGHFWTI